MQSWANDSHDGHFTSSPFETMSSTRSETPFRTIRIEGDALLPGSRTGCQARPAGRLLPRLPLHADVHASAGGPPHGALAPAAPTHTPPSAPSVRARGPARLHPPCSAPAPPFPRTPVACGVAVQADEAWDPEQGPDPRCWQRGALTDVLHVSAAEIRAPLLLACRARVVRRSS